MTYAKQLFLTELPIATTAQIDKGIKQLEALFSECEEYQHCFRDRRPAPTREEQDKNDFFHDFSFFIGCAYFDLMTTYTEDEHWCYYSKQFKLSSRYIFMPYLKRVYSLLLEERTYR